MTISPQVASDREFMAFKTFAKRVGFTVGESMPETTVHASLHVPGSWHTIWHWYAGRRRSLGADFNIPHGTNQHEKGLVYSSKMIKVAHSMGVALRYSYYGHVFNHDDHPHADAGSWTNLGRGETKVFKGDLCVWDLQALLERPQDNLLGDDELKAMRAIRYATEAIGPKFPYGKDYVQTIIDARPDNIWGPKSRAALLAFLKKYQAALKKYGFYSGKIDGIWGPGMEAAHKAVVRAYYNK